MFRAKKGKTKNKQKVSFYINQKRTTERTREGRLKENAHRIHNFSSLKWKMWAEISGIYFHNQ